MGRTPTPFLSLRWCVCLFLLIIAFLLSSSQVSFLFSFWSFSPLFFFLFFLLLTSFFFLISHLKLPIAQISVSLLTDQWVSPFLQSLSLFLQISGSLSWYNRCLSHGGSRGGSISSETLSLTYSFPWFALRNKDWWWWSVVVKRWSVVFGGGSRCVIRERGFWKYREKIFEREDISHSSKSEKCTK